MDSRERFLALTDEIVAAVSAAQGSHGAKATTAHFFGVSPSYLSRMASGSLTKVTPSVAERIERRAGIDRAYFFDNPDSRHWSRYRLRRPAIVEGAEARDRIATMRKIAKRGGDAPPEAATLALLQQWQGFPVIPALVQALEAQRNMDRDALRRWAPMVHRETLGFLEEMERAHDAELADDAAAQAEFRELFPLDP